MVSDDAANLLWVEIYWALPADSRWMLNELSVEMRERLTAMADFADAAARWAVGLSDGNREQVSKACAELPALLEKAKPLMLKN